MSAATAMLNGAVAHAGPANSNGEDAQLANSDMHDKVLHQFAQFETSRRMIACLVNEGMIGASVDQSGYLNLHQITESKDSQSLTIRVGLTGDAAREWLESTSKPYLQPSELSVPIMIRRDQAGHPKDVAETDPTVLFRLMTPWFSNKATSQEAVDTIIRQLKSSAENQGTQIVFGTHASSLELAHSQMFRRGVVPFGQETALADPRRSRHRMGAEHLDRTSNAPDAQELFRPRPAGASVAQGRPVAAQPGDQFLSCPILRPPHHGSFPISSSAFAAEAGSRQQHPGHSHGTLS